jgi:hypothetical protein
MVDFYHEKFIETMGKWILAEGNVENRSFVMKLKLGRGVITIGIWTIKDKVVRLMIRLSHFYKFPYSLDTIIRRIEVLDDRIFYVAPYDVVRVLDYTVYRVLRKDEVNISNLDDVFRLVNKFSKYLSDETQKDLNRIIEHLKKYESYVEY